MSDTDLVTADDSTENHTLSNSVTTDSSAGHDASGSATDAKSASDGSLSTMVLPELRALANRAGVKGTSGMRKNELIAAIRERLAMLGWVEAAILILTYGGLASGLSKARVAMSCCQEGKTT